jgi:dienelactone hydrolase
MRSVVVVSLMAFAACSAAAPRPAAVVAGAREEVIWIPIVVHGRSLRLQATVFRPSSPGRFPLAVVNHGTQAGVPGRSQPRYRAAAASAELVAEGFAVVLPMRRGYADSEGEQVRLRGADLEAYGRENALDVQAAVRWLRGQDFVDPDRILVVGQSTGGLATMAYLSMADPGVRGAVNFHGGVRPGDLEDDPLLDGRIAAFSAFARTTRLPSLWFYTANDHSSRPPFVSRLHAAYRAAGGDAELHQLGSFKRDGHALFGDPDGTPIWAPSFRAFGHRLGLDRP